MHILIIPAFRYVGKDYAVSTFVKSQVNALKKAGQNVGVIAPMPLVLKKNEIVNQFKTIFRSNYECTIENGVPVIRNNNVFWTTSRVPFVSNAYWVLLGLIMFKKYTKKYGFPEVIHAHDCVYAGELALLINSIYKIPYIVTEHNSNLVERFSMRLVRKKRKIFKKASVRVMVSKALGMLHEKYDCLKRGDWVELPNFLDEFFEEQSAVVPLDNQVSFNFLHIGHMTDIKNQSGLIRAFNEAFSKSPTVRLTIVGAGELYTSLIEEASKLPIKDQLEFTGILKHEEIVKYYQSSHVFILPSFFETFGVVLIEAMAFGLPVIAVKGSGPDSIIKETNGLLSPTADVSDLADTMKLMYENYKFFDRDAIRETCLERYSCERNVYKLLELYQISGC